MATVVCSVEAQASTLNGFNVHDDIYETIGLWAQISERFGA